MKPAIWGIEYHLPEKIETNTDLAAENPDWRMQDICDKVGISSRHIAASDETASDLALIAAAKLLGRNIVPKEQIDFLVVCTESPDHFLPPISCVLQDKLGLGKHVGAFDFNLACSGYVYGLRIAKSLVESGAARHVLLVTTDTYSKYIHPRDRTVRPLFGDAAAATLIGPSKDGMGYIENFVVGTDGRGAEKLIVPAGAARLPASAHTAEEITDDTGCTRSANNLYMDGRALFGFAISVVPSMIREVLEHNALETNDIDWFVYHQANKMMLETLAKLNNIPADRMVYSMADVGNTVSTSIPLAIQRYVEQGKIQAGQRLMLVGFGVGFSWAACTIRWGT